MLPIEPTEVEEGREEIRDAAASAGLQTVQEATATQDEEENPEFPAFDEAALPSIEELD